MTRQLSVAYAVPFVLAVALGAQAPASPPAAQPPAPAPSPSTAPKPAPVRRARPAPAAAALPLTLAVTDGVGHRLPDVSVRVTGPVEREGVTDRNGELRLLELRPGAYRLRFEGSRWITLEREITLDRTGPAQLDVRLNAAPPPPAPPAPPAPAPAPAAADSERPMGELRVADVAGIADKNLIRGNEPHKLTTLGCTGYATTRLVQVRDPLEERGGAEADETLYVVAGDGTFTAGGRSETLTPGVLVVVPRHTAHTLTRRGRGPLILLSVLSGPACTSPER